MKIYFIVIGIITTVYLILVISLELFTWLWVKWECSKTHEKLFPPKEIK